MSPCRAALLFRSIFCRVYTRKRKLASGITGSGLKPIESGLFEYRPHDGPHGNVPFGPVGAGANRQQWLTPKYLATARLTELRLSPHQERECNEIGVDIGLGYSDCGGEIDRRCRKGVHESDTDRVRPRCRAWCNNHIDNELPGAARHQCRFESS